MPKIRMLRARGDNEVIKGNFEIRKLDNFPGKIKAHDLVHDYFDILAAPKNPSNGRGNFSGRTPPIRMILGKNALCHFA